MQRRPWILAAAALVVLIVVAVVVLGGGGDDRPEAPRPGPAAALARLPADAEAVALVATDPGSGAMAAVRELLQRVPGSALAAARARRELGPLEPTFGQLEDLGGSPVAVALRDDGMVAAWQARDDEGLARVAGDAVRRGTLVPRGHLLLPAAPLPGLRAFAVDGPLLLAGSTADDVRAALRARRSPHRLALADGELARATLRPAALRRLPLAGDLEDLAARARGGVLRVTPDDDGLRARLRIAFARGTTLPLAPGRAPAAAPAAFDVPVTVGLRDPRAAYDTVLRVLGAADGYERANDVLRRLRRDDLDEVLRDQLTGTATVAWQPGGRVAVQLQLRDAGDARDLLEDVARIPDLLLGRTGIDVDEDDGVFTVRLPGAPELRVAVAGRRIGIATHADPRIVARRGPAARTTPGAGALAARLKAPELRQRILDRFALPRLALIPLDALGDLTVGASVAGDRLDVELALPVR